MIEENTRYKYQLNGKSADENYREIIKERQNEFIESRLKAAVIEKEITDTVQKALKDIFIDFKF